MSRPRTSIAALVCLIAFCAITFASLRHASLNTSRLMLALAVGVVGWACRRAWRGRTEHRAFWAGFAGVGAVYLVITLSPVLGERVAPRLPTTQLLDGLYPRLCRLREDSALIPRATFDQSFSDWSSAHPGVPVSQVGPRRYSDSFLIIEWLSGEQEPFRCAGHAAFAVLFGWLGGLAASLIAALAAHGCRTHSPIPKSE